MPDVISSLNSLAESYSAPVHLLFHCGRLTSYHTQNKARNAAARAEPVRSSTADENEILNVIDPDLIPL